MGIESDQLVYDYLSRVGDLAQQRQLPSGDRMRLVSSLRNEIDRQRAKYGTETPATVRRVLGGFGSPEDVVERAASGAGLPAPPVAEPPPRRAVPEQRDRLFPGRAKRVPRPRPRRAEPEEPPAPALPTPPHLAGLDELGPQGDEPDWWRLGPAGGPLGGDSVAGFVGGVEIPEILRPPAEDEEASPGAASAKGASARGASAGGASAGGARAKDASAKDASAKGAFAKGASAVDASAEEAEVDLVLEPPVRRRLRLRRPDGPRFSSPFLLLAAVLLVAGALFGLWWALGAGWLLAYASRRLTPAESKWAVFGLPGLVLVGAMVWLWGRQDGRWGEPIAAGGMGVAVSGVWPWVVRLAALASAAYLTWRAQRPLR
ncbi:hypothetical protein [Streptomyces sp. NPDC048111]|uniref:hypothetical protein n=1 Tax=Streptomyces sp. NPDC048111 TaxID=3365500 RepID=UPI003718A484